jgi:octaprenyl-diphosphate synthase
VILDFNEYFEKIEAVLQNALSEEPAFLAGPVKDMVNRGGKRWRPLLSLLVCEGLGGGEAVLPLLPLVELSHTASLIHDDIEDHSPLRRGKPSCHILYGEDAAINAGSFLYFHASACIDTWPGAAEKKARVFSLWSRYMRRLHTGQAFDIYWHNNFVIPCVDDYLRMCAMKTGCLAEFAAALAETLARETPAKESGETALLLQAASDMGVGFQIMDDVKNLRGGIAGKKRGDDIIEGKKSLPIILFLADKGEAERRFVENAFHAARAEGVDSPAVETCITALEQDGAIARAEQQGQNLLNEAFTALRDYPWTAREAMRTAWNVFRTRIGGGAGTGQ